jgi:mTERF
MIIVCMCIQQVTRDWLLMEMSDTSLNDSMFEDIADAADLPDSCRPQVAARFAVVHPTGLAVQRRAERLQSERMHGLLTALPANVVQQTADDHLSSWSGPPSAAPQVAFYHELGMSKAEIARMARSRTQLFYLALPTIESKLKFLREEAGITSADDMRKLLLKFPRIVEYKTERTLRPRLDFLKRYHIEGADISKVPAAAQLRCSPNSFCCTPTGVEWLLGSRQSGTRNWQAGFRHPSWRDIP